MPIKCRTCDLEFESIKECETHDIFSHKTNSPSIKKILILGGGFGALTVLKEIQKQIPHEKIKITIVSEKNFFLFTPMLPQVSSGLLHPSSIAIPIRNLTKNSKFYQATVDSIDLKQKLVTIQRTFDGKVHALEYDYLIIALGSKNNFFSNSSIESHSFPMKSLEDALAIRNHVLTMLEHADQTGSLELQKLFLTFVVIGAGFAGVETIGEINHLIKKSIRKYYPNIQKENINMILISSKNKILPEIDEKISFWAQSYLEKNGITILYNTHAKSAGEDYVDITNGQKIPCSTIIWTGGIIPDNVIPSLDCSHDNSGRIVVEKTLQLTRYENVFALGDCAAIPNGTMDTFYPSTAQHAIHEGKLVAKNLKLLLNGEKELKTFSFHSLGVMAIIGHKVGIANISGYSITGMSAWLLWRAYYLTKIPTFAKKFRIGFDWFVDFFIDRDLTLIDAVKKKTHLRRIFIANNPTLKEQLFSDI